MNDNLLTSGQFAKLSQSTKRTVLWYDQQGILKPAKVNEEGYRLYKPEQIIDFQVIMLLRKLNVSIHQIKQLLDKDISLKNLFILKQKTIQQEIKHLQTKLKRISSYYKSLDTNGTLVEPTVKTIPGFDAYIVEKTGPYSKIYSYALELKSYFLKIPKNAVYFVLFPLRDYKPQKDFMKIGVVLKGSMKLKKNAEQLVKKETIPPFKALSYTHVGHPSLISMILLQMREYIKKKKLKPDTSLPINELEFYIKSGLNEFYDEETMLSQLNIPLL